MTQINHFIYIGSGHSHAVNSITEVTGFEPGEETPYGITGDGFYFWDETEAWCHGPHASMQLAIESRDRYLETL